MTTSLAPGMASTAMNFDGTTTWRMNTAYVAAANWSYSFWVQTTDVTGLGYIIGGDDASTLTGVLISTPGNVLVVDLGATTTFTPVAPVNDGIPHHIVITAHSSAGVLCYVDGVSASAGAPKGLFAGKIYVLGTYAPGGLNIFKGVLQDLAVFDKALSTTEISELYNRSRGLVQEDSASRVTRLLDDSGWPALWRDITATPEATVGELVYNSATVNSKLQEVQDTEQGRIFAGKDNHLVFLSRYYTSEVTAGNTVQQIFSDDGGATALPYQSFGFDWHEMDVINDVTATTPTTWASDSDSTSITANDRHSKRVDTILTTFDDADAMARGLVAQYKDPTWRANPIVVAPVRNTARWDEVLTLELGYRASMEITPMAVGSQNAEDVTIEQIEWTITQGSWLLTVTGSPCRDVWFIWDDAGSLVDGPKVIGY